MQILVQILNFARREKASSKPPQVPEFPKRETMSSKMSWMKEAKITFQFFDLTSFVLLFFLKVNFKNQITRQIIFLTFIFKLIWILKLLIDCDRLTLQKPPKLKKYNYFTIFFSFFKTEITSPTWFIKNIYYSYHIWKDNLIMLRARRISFRLSAIW